jgi:pimeloyl-ACP methyl ester carboxylesterase
MITHCRDIDVAWFVIGRGDPMILIHGLADDHRAWRKIVPYLCMDHRVLLYDFRGHGQTSFGDADGTLRQLSEDLVALLDAIGLERATLVGFSLGGTIAMRAAIDHPSRFDRLVAVATSSRVGSTAAAWYRERVELVRRRDASLPQTLERDTRDVYFNAPSEFEAGLTIRRQSTADPRGYGNACDAMAGLNSQPLDPELSKIQAPTLVIAADRDQHCPPRAAEIIAAGIPGSHLEVIEGSGHPIPVEKPEAVATLIRQELAARRR